ncbi:KAP family P-loop NTPase fold protein [Nitrospira sp. BLG_2]|uniref:KAP family P-loop NTPase fold protein n=1 Tax=Nitrospira sp. BLG_2 TaxID=3397507 RepID=UPI003B9C307C
MNISPDRPIESLKGDRFGREAFVESIASAIRGWQGNESLIVSISGPWGSGKTSTKNMLKDSLGLSMPNNHFVEFNPWQWAGQNQLAEAFFREIEIALGKTPTSNYQKQAAKWRMYSAKLRVGRFVSNTTLQVIARVVAVITGAGLTWSFMTDHFGWFMLMLLCTGILIAWDKVLTVLNQFSDRWAELKEAQAALHEASMEDFKIGLRDSMKELPKPLLIIIDDIDRLTASQICYLFQLIKANADFPNLVYVLLMESQIVEQALDLITQNNGKEYLKKIVQVHLPLPLVAREKLISILEQDTRALISDPALRVQFDEFQWASAFTAISPLFRTLRDVHIFTNVLTFDLSVMKGKDTISANVLDLMCLTALKVLHEQIYQALPRGKRFLTRDMSGSNNDNDEVKRTRDSILSTSSEADSAIVVPLLGYIFPSFPWDDESFFHGGFNADEALRELRVHHPKNFDRYFIFSVGSNDISQDEFEEFLQVLPCRAKSKTSLENYFQRGVLVSMLERLTAYSDIMEIQNIESLLITIFDISDECLPPWEDDRRSAIDTFYIELSRRLLMRINDFDKRLHTLSSAIQNSTGLYLPIGKVSIEGSGSDHRTSGLTDEQLQPLRATCLSRIKEWAADGRLIKHHALGFILLCWQRWDTTSEWKEWTISQTATKEGLLAICSSLMGRSYSGEGVNYYVEIDKLQMLVDIDLIETRLAHLDRSQLTEREIELVDLFFLSLQSQRRQQSSNEQKEERTKQRSMLSPE